jgi:hypothetical protein
MGPGRVLEKGSLRAPRLAAPYYTAPFTIGRDPTRASGSPFSAACEDGRWT